MNTATYFACCVMVFLLALLVTIAIEGMWRVLVWLVAMAAVAGLVQSCSSSPEYKARVAAKEAQEAADRKPRLVSEVDGCKIYAFKAGDHWQYFTRCPNSQTTTDTAHDVQSGKTHRTEHDTITTETK